MADLKRLHEGLGLSNVTAFLQTGNIIFESDGLHTVELAGSISKEFENKFGFYSEVMLRTSVDLKEICDQNPFLTDPQKEARRIVIMFLTSAPEKEALARLLNSYSGPEEILIGPTGQELYIYYTNDIGHSKLTNALIEKHLKVPGTGRNWNTTTTLLALLQR